MAVCGRSHFEHCSVTAGAAFINRAPEMTGGIEGYAVGFIAVITRGEGVNHGFLPCSGSGRGKFEYHPSSGRSVSAKASAAEEIACGVEYQIVGLGRLATLVVIARMYPFVSPNGASCRRR